MVTPGNATLVRDLNLCVKAGTNLLVTGPNGSGKSSLFRVLGGLWPLTRGSIAKPGGTGAEDGLAHEIFYVPQRPYVTIGTLEEQILYPRTRDLGQAGPVIPEADLRELLREVELEYLLDREGGSSAVVNWGESLSLGACRPAGSWQDLRPAPIACVKAPAVLLLLFAGEQQRLGMARLFYHRPKFAILDECTSGVTNEMEQRFSERVQELGCTCITISHRPALMAFHDLVLHLDGEGGWSVHQGQRALEGGISTIQEEGSGAAESEAAKLRARESQDVLKGMTSGSGKARRSRASPGLSLRKGDVRHSMGSGLDIEEKVIDRAAPADPTKLQQDLSKALSVRLHPDYTKGPLQRFQTLSQILLPLGTSGAEYQRLVVIAAVVLARTALSDRIASLNGKTVEFVLKQDAMGFARLIGVSVLQSAASAITAPALRYVTDALGLLWRRRLTQSLGDLYLKGDAYYAAIHKAGLQDADARITRDVERLCDDLSALIPSMVKPVVDICWFSWRMYLLTGRRGMGTLYIYMLLGFGALRAVTPDFGKLAAEEQLREGAFRNVHARLRTHAESIAFYGGGRKEGETVSRYFKELQHHLRKVVRVKWAYTVADDFFTKQLPHNVTWGLSLLYALDNASDTDDTARQGLVVHNMRYLASVVTQCFTAFGEILGLQKRVAELSGGVTRVSELLEVLKEAKRTAAGAAAAGEGDAAGQLALQDVDLLTPDGKVLARQLNLDVRAGSNTLVTGPNGSGKTSIFRLLRGLWPLISGRLLKSGAAVCVLGALWARG